LQWTQPGQIETQEALERVYCNGRCLGQHEGFYAPFEFAVGAFLLPDAVNTIVVELHNDAICDGVKLNDGTLVAGDKVPDLRESAADRSSHQFVTDSAIH
jgi:hypothetical protein